MWPHAPLEVRQAAIRAALYDLGPYPALGEGDDFVVGELWFIAQEQMANTLVALDAIEGYCQTDCDLYVRREVDCVDDNGESRAAYTYFYADEEALARAARVFPGDDGQCKWTANQS